MKKKLKKKIEKEVKVVLFSFAILILLIAGYLISINKLKNLKGDIISGNVFLDNENSVLNTDDDSVMQDNLSSDNLNNHVINLSLSNNIANNTTPKTSGGGGSSSGNSNNNPVPETPSNNSSNKTSSNYPLHEDITVTIFWVGEKASEENDYISNMQSAWDDKWLEHFVNENTFYFALPYNDFENGKRKSDVYNIVYWHDEKSWSQYESMCKNKWIKITKRNKTAYAQWEDVGPFKEDDFNYVFGNSTPKNKENNHAGLDVSPAVHDFLNLQDIDKVSWQFVNFSEVPEGPWKIIITDSQIFWD